MPMARICSSTARNERSVIPAPCYVFWAKSPPKEGVWEKPSGTVRRENYFNPGEKHRNLCSQGFWKLRNVAPFINPSALMGNYFSTIAAEQVGTRKRSGD